MGAYADTAVYATSMRQRGTALESEGFDMAGKKQQDGAMTADQRDQLAVLVISGSEDWSEQARTLCRLESVRWAVDHGRMSETPTEPMIRRAIGIPRGRGGAE